MSYPRTSTSARCRCATGCRSSNQSRCRPSLNCWRPSWPPGFARSRPPRSYRHPGARAGRRRRAGRRAAPLRRHRLLRVGGQPQRRQARTRRRSSLHRIRGVGVRRAQPRERRAVQERGHRADRRDRRRRPRQRRVRGGHRCVRVGLPVRRADSATAGDRDRRAGRDRGADRLALADTIGTTTPRGPADLFADVRDVADGIPLVPISTTPAPAWPARTPP